MLLAVSFFVLCLALGSVRAAEQCPGASLGESQEDFKWKYEQASIVAYGTALEVKNNLVKFQISCVLKGTLPLLNLDLPQLAEVSNTTECHYLTAQKTYVVFLQTLKAGQAGNTLVYALANMEEIEINADTVNKFLGEECDDEDDHGIEMTMFYYDNNRRCGQFSAVCNEMSKGSIQTLNYPPLSKTTTFLGGFKKVLDVPKMSDDDEGSINGKQSGVGDDKTRNTASLPSISIFASLISFILVFTH